MKKGSLVLVLYYFRIYTVYMFYLKNSFLCCFSMEKLENLPKKEWRIFTHDDSGVSIKRIER